MENKNAWVDNLLAIAGIKINGSNPWDIKIINEKVFDRIKAEGSIGLGESYMDGWWECKNLDQFFYKLFLANVPDSIGFSLPLFLDVIKAKIFNLQAKNRAFQVGEKHYDLDNKLFSAMLGKTMAYSCGYWKEEKDLDSAQIAKYDLICRKLNLKKGPSNAAGRQRILEIGCGWGGFLKHAAKEYGISGLGITVSKEQADFARKSCSNLPVEIRTQDYRELNERFDHIVSVGMFEHVGQKNYRNFFNIARKCLKDNGLFLLHTIGNLENVPNADPWLNKYIFPNGSLPCLSQILSGAGKNFIVEDVHNFGADYDRTLMEWHKNFNKAWPKFKDKYDERFYRMWNYYLLSCAGNFRARHIPLWQIVLSPHGVPGGYKSVR